MEATDKQILTINSFFDEVIELLKAFLFLSDFAEPKSEKQMLMSCFHIGKFLFNSTKLSYS